MNDLRRWMRLCESMDELLREAPRPSYTIGDEPGDPPAVVAGTLRQALRGLRKPNGEAGLRSALRTIADNPRMRRFVQVRVPADAWMLNGIDTASMEGLVRMSKAIIAHARFPEPPNMPNTGDRLQDLLDWLITLEDHPAPKRKSLWDSGRTWGHIVPISRQVDRGWLVHFTKDVDSILATGLHGTHDSAWLGLTFRERGKGPGGFNFAYPALSKEAMKEANFTETDARASYGYNALLFPARYILVNHLIDKDQQAIFLGDEVRSFHVLRRTKSRQAGQFLWTSDGMTAPYEEIVRKYAV